MEQKTNKLKASSKVVAILMKIGYIAMIVGMCICASSLIFMAVTGGKTSIVIGKGTTIGITDKSALSTTELVAMFSEALVMSALLFVIFLMAYRMFHEISATGDPFITQYAKTVRVFGILIVAITFAMGIMETAILSITATNIAEKYTEFPGIGAGVIIFCISYIIDYGCGLKEQQSDK